MFGCLIMKKNTFYSETSESEADLNDRLRYLCVLMCRTCISDAKMRKKNSEIENGLRNLQNNNKKKLKK